MSQCIHTTVLFFNNLSRMILLGQCNQFSKVDNSGILLGMKLSIHFTCDSISFDISKKILQSYLCESNFIHFLNFKYSTLGVNN